MWGWWLQGPGPPACGHLSGEQGPERLDAGAALAGHLSADGICWAHAKIGWAAPAWRRWCGQYLPGHKKPCCYFCHYSHSLWCFPDPCWVHGKEQLEHPSKHLVLCFQRKTKVTQVWNNMRVSKYRYSYCTLNLDSNTSKHLRKQYYCKFSTKWYYLTQYYHSCVYMYYLHPPCWLFCFHLVTNEPLWCSRVGRRCWMVFWRAGRSLQSTDESPAARSPAECPTSLCLHYHSKHPKNMKTSFLSVSTIQMIEVKF